MNDEETVKIVNRSDSYIVSKKILCSEIPYFEKMFCCDLIESHSSEVTVDHDEDAFHNVLNHVMNDHLMLNMELVIPTLHVADYLMMDNLQNLCIPYFRGNFNIKELPKVLKYLSSVNYQMGLINNQMIDNFIKRHFEQISNTRSFLNFSAEIIEYICRLDVIIDSEYQVLDAIIRWIKVNEDERIIYKDQLMKCIRWKYLNGEDKEKIKLNNFNINFDKIMEESKHSDYDIKNRVMIKFLVTIYKLSATEIQVLVYKNSTRWINYGKFTLKNDLCCNLITNESSITDIIYDDGIKGIRLDWKEKKFKYLILFDDENSYYGQMFRYIMNDPPLGIG